MDSDTCTTLLKDCPLCEFSRILILGTECITFGCAVYFMTFWILLHFWARLIRSCIEITCFCIFLLHDVMLYLNYDWIIVLLFLVWMTVWWISLLSLHDCTFDRAAPVAHWWRWWWGVRVPRAKCWGSIHVLWGLANRVLQNVQ